MKVGFTGTQHGCTKKQYVALKATLEAKRVTEFHHGGCIGADVQAHAIMVDRTKVIVHWGNNKRKQGDCPGAYREMPATDPLLRNKVIVRCVGEMVATPNRMYEEQRSGTWMTIRHAIKLKRRVTFVWPDGSVTVKEPTDEALPLPAGDY